MLLYFCIKIINQLHVSMMFFIAGIERYLIKMALDFLLEPVFVSMENCVFNNRANNLMNFINQILYL